ncbi:F-box protein SKIP14-like [Hibiscus syriacus]|uniref:F-box protein SKIP14-like n=1 Tax=Hibiscus syriacus TaxID=106335 RepID=UPI0019250D3F|nr:F-box protein SKIP14-like [Hibiscus syriacus]
MALNWDGFGNSWSCNWDTEILCGITESKGFYEAVNDDIADRLPEDPFGMEIRSTFAAAVTGLFQDFENDLWSDFCMFGMKNDEEKKISDQQHMFKDLNWLWNGTMSFQPEEGVSSYGFSSEEVDKTIGDQSSHFQGVNWVWNNLEINKISDSDDDFNGVGIDFGLAIGGSSTNDEGKGLEDCKGVFCDTLDGGDPSDSLFLALGYLGVKDLLAVERVCRSLRDAVRSDILLWRSIHIEHSLSRRITNDALLKLTNRAQGTLECLSLVGCINITDDGLKHVLESNPKLTKLSLPECTGLSFEGILLNLKAFKSIGSPGIKHLRIGGCFCVTEDQFKELKFLLGADNSIQSREQKPQFFRQGQLHFMCDDDRVIDIEICPRCEKLRLVYDCPSESCRKTHNTAQLCRACFLCIARCFHCGSCFKHCDYEETFTLDLLCFNCLKHILGSEENPEVIGTSYQFYLYG